MTDLITLPRATVQQALEAWEHINKYSFVLADYEVPMEQAIAALKVALEQPEPPPEAQTEAEKIAYCAGWWAAMEQKREQPEQEPVAWMRPDNRVAEESTARTQFSRGAVKPPIGTWVPLYTHPPRRDWRGLSEEEIHAALPHEPGDLDFVCARAIEAALRSKNHDTGRTH
jgi:hypothetical protein